MADSETHRGGFGTHGGESGAFIERAFREKIVLVGVTLAGGDPQTAPTPIWTSWPSS